MLTPIDMQSKTFKSGMGYSKADVDSYFKALASDYEALYRENIELKDKINTLNEGINHYKTIEKSLQKALILAEQTAEETINGAKTNATVIEQEAVLKAQSIVADAKIELDQIRSRTVNILQQYESYRAQFRALAQAQIDVLNSESFDIEIASLDVFTDLEKHVAKNAANINANTQFQNPTPMNVSEDMDETLTDDIQINDFASLFEESN